MILDFVLDLSASTLRVVRTGAAEDGAQLEDGTRRGTMSGYIAVESGEGEVGLQVVTFNIWRDSPFDGLSDRLNPPEKYFKTYQPWGPTEEVEEFFLKMLPQQIIQFKFRFVIRYFSSNRNSKFLIRLGQGDRSRLIFYVARLSWGWILLAYKNARSAC